MGSNHYRVDLTWHQADFLVGIVLRCWAVIMPLTCRLNARVGKSDYEKKDLKPKLHERNISTVGLDVRRA